MDEKEQKLRELLTEVGKMVPTLLVVGTTADKLSVLLTVWQVATSQCDEIYKAMLIHLRDEIDKQLKNKQLKDKER